MDLLFNDPDRNIQKSALFALSQVSGERGINALINVVRDHPDKEIRKKAIDFLQRTGDSRAQEFLQEFIEQGAK